MRLVDSFAPILLTTLLLTAAPLHAQDVPMQTYTLANGMTVTLLEDHSLPQVTINTWFAVGSKDEPAGRTGFAHLFEHLMFMGSERVPGNSFDVIMESGGGANNASTSTDRTNYYSWGPSSLLPTLLWLDAERLDSLGRSMTQEKLDLQRSVVKNERRQNYENRPYGAAQLIIPSVLYPEGHPYHHPVIGSHEDLESASLEDVTDFFETYYVPGNASLVVAGDFDSTAVRQLISRTFGAVPAKPLPTHRRAQPPTLDHERRRLAVDEVEHPRLYLVWHSPPHFAPGDAEMDLLATILADGASSRLNSRLIIEERLAKDVSAYQVSKELGSEFRIQVTATADTDLEVIKRAVLEEIERLRSDGPTENELQRAQSSLESSFLRHMESLRARADALNKYRHFWGDANSFERDLERYTAATEDDLRRWAIEVFTDGRLDLRVLPAGAREEGGNLDERPADLQPTLFQPATPQRFQLSNGIPVHFLYRPGTGLFSGTLLANGGERLLPADEAGLAALTATMLTSGAGGRDAAAFADAVQSLGATLHSTGGWHDMRVSVSGLSTKAVQTLDLFRDAILRPNLEQADFLREKDLALAAIHSRTESPSLVAAISARALLYGRDHARGRPRGGYATTVEPLDLDDVLQALPRLLNPATCQMVFAGDVAPENLRELLEERFGGWSSETAVDPPLAEPVTEAPGPRTVLVNRPGAPQTVLYMIRPLAPPPDDRLRAQRRALDTILGGSFTSRLNQNIREEHGFSYGAGSRISQNGNLFTLRASSSVQTAVTGAALAEFKKEFGALATGDVGEEELSKALRTIRYELLESAETTNGVTNVFTDLLADGRPLDSIATELEALDSVSLDGANDVARSGLYSWEDLLVVLVGDKEAILPQLAAEGFEVPEVMQAEEIF